MSGATFKGESDQELVHRALVVPGSENGREAASELLDRYRERVYIWCHRYVRDHDRAMDLAQDVLLRAYGNLSSFAGRSSFSSWLFAIARNRCISEVRRVSLAYDEEVDPDQIAIDDRNPETELERAQAERALLALIHGHLTPREQEAIWLRCVDRMPLEAIARVLAIEERSGARGVLQQARRKLKAALNKGS